MGLFPLFKSKRVDRLENEVKELRGTINNSWNWYDHYFGTGNKSITVNRRNALTIPAVLAAMNILTDTLNLPVDIFKINGDKKTKVDESDPYEYKCKFLLNTSPNQLQTPAQWFKAMEYSRNVEGNAISYIVRDRMGTPLALRFVDFRNVEINNNGIRNFYTLKRDDGTLIIRDAPHWDVIHVRGGYDDKSPLDWAVEALSLSKEAQRAGTEFFADGMTAKYVFSHPGALDATAQKNLKDSLKKEMQDGNTVVLEEGIKPHVLSVTPEQSQYNESKIYGISEVGRTFNIPNFMLVNSEPTYTNIEQFHLYFVTHNVRPRARMYEQEFNWKLLGNKDNFYTKINMDALLRADLKTRFESYAIGIQNEFLAKNEARDLENRNPYEGGDEFKNPAINPQNTNNDEQE